MDVEVRALRPDELEASWRLSRIAFNVPPERREAWLANVDPARCQGVFVAGELVATAAVTGGGQFFGGRSVPAGLVHRVTTAPEHRGRGYASMAMLAALEDMRSREEAVSALYPASTRLYRGLGYEVGGVWTTATVPCRSLLQLPPGAADAVRRGVPDDLPAMQALYRSQARHRDGHLDRPERFWRLRAADRWDEVHVYVAEGDDGDLAGYVVYRHTPRDGWGYGIHVEDLVASSPDAAVALWRLTGSSNTQVEEVTFSGPPEHPLLLLLPEQDVRPKAALRWMVRLVDLPRAVAARGYRPEVTAGADLEIRDRHCPWNEGRWRLTVADGAASLARGGDGTVVLGAGAAAALWSGYASAPTLAAAGLLASSSERDVTALTAAFAGPTPWMPDFF